MEDNAFLIREARKEEICQIIHYIILSKHFHMMVCIQFFIRNVYIGKNVIHVVRSFLAHGHMLREINKAYLTLISKIDNLCVTEQADKSM